MPAGKSIAYSEGEYPELDGLPAGSKVKLEIMATIEGDEGGERSLVFDKVGIETEGMADRELKSMSQQNAVASSQSKGYSEDF